MDSTGFQLLLFALGGLILLVAWPARRRINSRDLSGEIEKLRSQLQNRPTSSSSSSEDSDEVEGGQPEEAVHPLEKYLAACLKRGVRPTPVEVDNMCRRLDRKNYYVPSVFEFLDEYDNRKAELASQKSGTGVFGFPEQDLPVREAAAPAASAPVNQSSIEGTAPDSGSDMRVATIAALREIPSYIKEVPAPDFDQLSIPLLYNGAAWAWLALTAGNHTGVFGMTRSGKGNALQHILLQALTFGPEIVRAIVLDAKGGLDYAFCDDLEHASLYSDKTISDGLQVALVEMERRKALLRSGRYRNHYEYQQKTGKTLPLIVVIADELTQFTDEQNAQLVTLACVSGAMGFILLLATQHPLAKYLPTSVQANVGFRLVFRLASSEQIRIAMKRTRDDDGTYNPALIGANQKGVGVLRGPGGEETLGRVPEVTDEMRDALITELVNRWPKTITKAKGTESVPTRAFPPEKPLFELKMLHFERGTVVGTQREQGQGTPESSQETLFTGEGTVRETPLEEDGNSDATSLGTPEIDDEVIAALIRGELSKRKIMKLLKGKNEKRLERISLVEAKVKGEQANG